MVPGFRHQVWIRTPLPMLSRTPSHRYHTLSLCLFSFQRRTIWYVGSIWSPSGYLVLSIIVSPTPFLQWVRSIIVLCSSLGLQGGDCLAILQKLLDLLFGLHNARAQNPRKGAIAHLSRGVCPCSNCARKGCEFYSRLINVHILSVSQSSRHVGNHLHRMFKRWNLVAGYRPGLFIRVQDGHRGQNRYMVALDLRVLV